MVTTPVDTFASVLRDVPGGVRSRVAKLNIDDERIAGYLKPRGRETFLFDPVALGEHVQVSVPTVVTAATFDLDEEYAALLRLVPQYPTTKLHESSVQSIDVDSDGVVSLAEGQGDETELATLSELAHAGSDMSCTFRGTGLTESISTPVAGNSIHVRLINATQHPSVTTTATETGESVLSIVGSFQGSEHAITSGSPTGVTEGYANFVVGGAIKRPRDSDRLLTTQRRDVSCRLQRCFEGIESIG
jgi:hypothetical protein